MENEINNAKQLLILGNGFDKACGLNSDYSDFFNERFSKIDKKSIINTLLRHKPNNHGSIRNFNAYGLGNQKFYNFDGKYENKVNYFDLLFIATQKYIQMNETWSDIEQILQEILQFIYKEDPSSKNKSFNNYKFNSDKEILTFKNFLLHIFSNTSTDKTIKKALEEYERLFGKFITTEINKQSLYMTNVKYKLNQLIKEESDVLSFNYSATPLLDSELSNIDLLHDWYNVHGLSRWGSDYRTIAVHKTHNNNVILPKPIFGISKYDQTNDQFLSVNDPIYQFTKNNRRKEKIERMKRGYNFLNYRISSNIDLVTIFGHSLGMADYDYFKNIFQKLDLANGNLKLEIYYYGKDDKILEDNFKRMLEEYSHTVSMNRDDLYSKLCNEKRVIFKNSKIIE